MYYYIYENIKSNKENYGNNFMGIVKTEDEAKKYCDRQNNILALDTEEHIDRFFYVGIDKNEINEYDLLDLNIINCNFFSALVTFLPEGGYVIKTLDDGINRSEPIITYNIEKSLISVFSSFSIDITEEKLVEMANKLIK